MTSARGEGRRGLAPSLPGASVTRALCRGGLPGLEILEKKDPEAQSQVVLLWPQQAAFRQRGFFEPFSHSRVYFSGFSSSSS